MKIYFKKYKYTHQLFYTSILGASAEITAGTIKLDLPMFPELSTTFYFFEDVVRKTQSLTTYKAYRLGYDDVIFIDLHQNHTKVSIYNEKLEGIILKI